MKATPKIPNICMQMWTTKNTDSFKKKKKKNSGIEDSSEKESGKKQTRSSGKSQVSTTNVRICSELLVTVTVLTLMTEIKQLLSNFFFFLENCHYSVYDLRICVTPVRIKTFVPELFGGDQTILMFILKFLSKKPLHRRPLEDGRE